jgi:hypothetical protein
MDACLCVYMLCCPVLLEAFATSSSLVQRSPTTCLVRVRNPKRASDNVDRRSKPNIFMIVFGLSIKWYILHYVKHFIQYIYPAELQLLKYETGLSRLEFLLLSPRSYVAFPLLLEVSSTWFEKKIFCFIWK